MKIVIGDIIRNLRKKNGISQEVLAEKLGVSVQAVSKWECNSSYPDLTLIPEIADFFKVTIDYLLLGSNCNHISKDYLITSDMPDDDVLRIAQYKGNKMLTRDEYDPEIRIMLKIDNDNETVKSKTVKVEIWGSADIDGNINGSVTAGDSINCGQVNGGVSAGRDVHCGQINGGVRASGNVCCGNVDGGVTCDDNVHCGNVGGNVSAGDAVACGNVNGSVSAGESIQCGNIDGGILQCGGDIHCREIKGKVNCEGNIVYHRD